MQARKAVIPAAGLDTRFLRAVRSTGPRCGVGTKADWLRPSVRMAAERPDVGPEFRAFPREMVGSW